MSATPPELPPRRSAEYILLEALVREHHAFREETRATLKAQAADIKALQAKASLWGGVAGTAAAVAGLLAQYLGK